MNRVPVLSVDLIDKLDKMFPHRCATKHMTCWDIAYDSGQRKLIDTLMEWVSMDTLDNTEDKPNIDEE